MMNLKTLYIVYNYEVSSGTFAIENPSGEAGVTGTDAEEFAGLWKTAKGGGKEVSWADFNSALGGRFEGPGYEKYLYNIFQVVSDMMSTSARQAAGRTWGTVGQHCFKVGAYVAQQYEPAAMDQTKAPPRETARLSGRRPGGLNVVPSKAYQRRRMKQAFM